MKKYMQSFTAVVLGATGLIGEQLLQQLLNDDAFSKVRILVRRQVQLSHPKLEVQLVDFDNLEDYTNKVGKGDCIFCCVGTTNKKVHGDNIAYRKVDLEIPVKAGKISRNAGFTSYLLVSAVGANADARNFYLKLKGTVEKEIELLQFPSFQIFRPSILLGKRKEFRLGEIIGKRVMQAFAVLFVGGLNKYKGIESSVVAKAMVVAAKSADRGIFVHHYKEMREAAGDVDNRS
jgi:uncharacterized protein YbjT (DUF2867 family)